MIQDETAQNQILSSVQTYSLQDANGEDNARVVIHKHSDLRKNTVKRLHIALHEDFFIVSAAITTAPAPLSKNSAFELGLSVSVNKKRQKAIGHPSIGLPYLRIPLSQIRMDDFTFFYRDSLEYKDLAGSLKEHGQQVPIILRGPKPYIIISGFLRVNALKSLGENEVLSLVHNDLTDDRAHDISIIDNAQRKSLSDFELIRALAAMKDRGRTTIEIANLLGKGRRIVERYFRVWNGPEDIKLALREGQINISAAMNAVDLSLPIEKVIGKSVRQILQQSSRATVRPEGPIYFRAFDSGRVTLRMQFDRRRHSIENVIGDLESIITELKLKKHDFILVQENNEHSSAS
jgi:ParB/RepB/Spo0J family partition protein